MEGRKESTGKATGDEVSEKPGSTTITTTRSRTDRAGSEDLSNDNPASAQPDGEVSSTANIAPRRESLRDKTMKKGGEYFKNLNNGISTRDAKKSSSTSVNVTTDGKQRVDEETYRKGIEYYEKANKPRKTGSTGSPGRQAASDDETRNRSPSTTRKSPSKAAAQASQSETPKGGKED